MWSIRPLWLLAPTVSSAAMRPVCLARIQKAKQVAPIAWTSFCSPRDSVPALRSDDFDAFIRQRATALLKLIEAGHGQGHCRARQRRNSQGIWAALSS